MEIFENKNNEGKVIERYEGRKEDGKIVRDGKYERWYETGEKECEGEFLENSKYGTWSFWKKDGTLYKKAEFIQDKEIESWQLRDKAKDPEAEIAPEVTAEKEEAADIKPEPVYVPEEPVKQKKRKFFDNRVKKPALFVRSDQRYEDERRGINPMYYVIGALSLILIALLIFVVPERDQNMAPAEETKTQITKKTLTDTAATVREKFNEWINLTNAKDINNLMELYADEVNYYRGGPSKKEDVRKDKENFFNKYNTVKVNADNVATQIENKTRYIFIYEKTYSFNDGSGAGSSGKLKSRLVFQNIDGDFRIITEKDEGSLR